MNKLNDKIWYRFIQVIFGIVVSLSFIILIVALFNIKPHKIIDLDRSTFVCTDKDSKNFNQSFGFKGTSVYLNNDGTLPEWNQPTVNHFCTTGDYLYTGNGTYYTIIPIFEYDSSWNKFFWEVVVSLIVLSGFWLLIRKLFLYIVLGRSKDPLT